MIRVLAVDDHEVFLQGLARLLDTEVDLELVGTAFYGQEGVETARLLQPNVIALDLQLLWQREERTGPSQENGIRLIEAMHIACPTAYILVVSGFADRRWLVRAIHAGAQGFVSKEASADEIISAIRLTGQGRAVLTAEQMAWLREPVENLTPREQEVLLLLKQGRSDAEIASHLGIERRTASKHVESIREKLGASSRLEAVALAEGQGLL